MTDTRRESKSESQSDEKLLTQLWEKLNNQTFQEAHPDVIAVIQNLKDYITKLMNNAVLSASQLNMLIDRLERFKKFSDLNEATDLQQGIDLNVIIEKLIADIRSHGNNLKALILEKYDGDAKLFFDTLGNKKLLEKVQPIITPSFQQSFENDQKYISECRLNLDRIFYELERPAPDTAHLKNDLEKIFQIIPQILNQPAQTFELYIKTYRYLGILHRKNSDFVQSNNMFFKAVEVTTSLHGVDPFFDYMRETLLNDLEENVKLLFYTGNKHFDNKKNDEATHCYTLASELLKKLIPNTPDNLCYIFIPLHTNLIRSLVNIGQINLATRFWAETLNVFRDFAKEHPDSSLNATFLETLESVNHSDFKLPHNFQQQFIKPEQPDLEVKSSHSLTLFKKSLLPEGIMNKFKVTCMLDKKLERYEKDFFPLAFKLTTPQWLEVYQTVNAWHTQKFKDKFFEFCDEYKKEKDVSIPDYPIGAQGSRKGLGKTA